MKTTALMKLMLRLLRGDTEPALLEAIDYLMAEVRVLRKKYEQDCGQPSAARRPEELPHRRKRPMGAATACCSTTSSDSNWLLWRGRSSGTGSAT